MEYKVYLYEAAVQHVLGGHGFGAGLTGTEWLGGRHVHRHSFLQPQVMSYYVITLIDMVMNFYYLRPTYKQFKGILIKPVMGSCIIM